MGDGPGDKTGSEDLVDIGGLLSSSSRMVSSTGTKCILFNSKMLLQKYGDLENSGKVWSKKGLPLIGKKTGERMLQHTRPT